jgi:oligosaccharide repeat unit polymerase
MKEAPSRSVWRLPVAVAAVLGGVLAAGRPPSWFAILVGFVLLLSIGLMHAAVSVLDLRRITFPALWWILYLGTVLVPGLVVAGEHDHPHESRFLFAILSALVTVPVGMILVNRVTGFRRKEISEFFARASNEGEASLHREAVFWAAVLVSACFVVLYLSEVHTIPLFFLLRHPGAAAEAVLLREESFKLLDSPFRYAYDVVRRVLLPLLITIAFGQYLRTRTGARLAGLAIVAGLGVFFAALSLAKTPVALIALTGFFYWYLYRGGRLSLKGLFIGTGLVFAFPVAVLLELGAGSDIGIWALLGGILRRLFVLTAELLYAYFEIFPDRVGFLHGSSIGRLAWLLGQPVFDLSGYAYGYVFPGVSGGIESGTAPAPFLGYFYADFGMVGVVLGGLLAGCIMQGVHCYLIRRGKSVVTLAAYAFMYWAFWQANLGALPQALLSGGVAFVLISIIGFDVGEKVLRRATTSVLTVRSTGQMGRTG